MDIFGQKYILQIYCLFIIILLPAIVFIVLNIILLGYTCHWFECIREIQPYREIVVDHRSNKRLVKHLLIMFTVFIVGWSPIYIILCIDTDDAISPIIYQFCSFLSALSLLINLIDLFRFNDQLRTYFYQLFNTETNRIQPIITIS